MKRIVGAVGGVVALGAAAAIAVPSMSNAAPGGRQFTFTVVSHDARGTITPADFGAAPRQNQQASADAPVTYQGKAIGRTETIVTITRVHGSSLLFMIECSVSLNGGSLPHGKILFNGSANFTKVPNGVAIPVVGGAGQWSGVTGQVVMTGINGGKATRLDFDIHT